MRSRQSNNLYHKSTFNRDQEKTEAEKQLIKKTVGNKVPYKKNKDGKRLPVCSCHVKYKMVECSFTNKVVLGLSAVAVT